MLVAQHLQKLSAHLATSLARLHVLNLTQRNSVGGVVWHRKQEMPVARARVSRTGKLSDFTTLTSQALGAVQTTLGVGGCGNIRFGHVLVAIRQGQRRYTVATGEERFGRCTEG